MARYSFVVCRPSGEPVGEAVNASARSIGRQLNSARTATVVLQLGDALAPSLLPGFARLKVYRAPTAAELAANPGATRTLVFYGSLPAENLTFDGNADTATAVFADPRWKLARCYAAPNGSEVYTATDQGLIAWGLVNTQNGRTGGDTWLRQGATTTGILRDRTYDRQLVSQLLDDLTQVLDGPDIDVIPQDGFALTTPDRTMGLFTVYARQGTDRPNAVFGYGPDILSNVQNAAITYLPVTTLATMIGTDANGVPVIGTYGTPDANGFGLLEDYSAAPDVSVQATVDAETRGAIFEEAGLRPVVTITQPLPDAPRAFVDYDAGDTIRVNIKRGAMTLTNAALRVHGFDLAIDQEGAENVTLTLA